MILAELQTNWEDTKKMVLKRALGCLSILTLASGMLWAQDAPKVAHTTRSAAPVTKWSPPAGHTPIFTNLGPGFSTLYNPTTGYYVLGPDNSSGYGEQWIALPFTPRANASATLLVAAIGIESGTSLIDLGLYSDDGGDVGTLLASGHSTKIPAFGTCCGVVEVTIPATALQGGTQYWIAATTDDTNAPDFTGVFESTNQSTIGYNPALEGWFTFSGNVPAVGVFQ